MTGAEEIEYRGDIIRLVRVRNPWGEIEWTGPWSDRSPEWQHVCVEDRERLRHKSEDGEFWMAFSDFQRQFSVLEVCSLTPDAVAGGPHRSWALHTFDGHWRRGSTAGGCRNFPKTFWMNPQFVIRLEEEDDDAGDGEEGCSFLVGLIQKNRRNRRTTRHSMHTIGFTIYEVPEKFVGQRNVHLDQRFFRSHAQKARSESFIDLREVVTHFCLPPGEYLIVPSTFQPGKDGDFFMRVFTEKQSQFQELDDPIEFKVEEEEVSEDELDNNFKTLFGKLAGEDEEISAFELKRILNRVMTKHTDLKTDGFGLETCRSMINLLDKDGNGKLGLLEFKTLWAKIEKYLSIYRQRDEDKSGTMSATEMREAVEQAGFSLSSALHQILVTRYSGPDLTIDFDSFVCCLMRLESMFQIFKALDRDGSGQVEFNLYQWLHVALL